MTKTQHTPKTPEKITFPKTGPANKYGVQLLFEDEKLKILRWDNRLVRRWKDGRLSEYAMLEEKDSIIPDFVEWQKMIDLREYKWTEKEDGLINPVTGHLISADQLNDILGSDKMALGG
ncbi:MAG: hypothetical protein H8D23_11935 [Candidatus Brocadiales bacterium]|nr:hypothetical protein [Candidatus Brocadiales bacterium]MBL7110149.1 hypothetical protein [Candidatus Neomarinimicrobiota bacterium]